MSMVQGRTWRDGVEERDHVPVAELSELLADPRCLVWLDLVDPEPELLASLAEELALDRHAVEDAAAPFERPKATRHAGHVFLTCYATSLTIDAADGPRLATPRISAFVLPNGLITVRSGEFDFDQVLQRWSDEGQLGHGVGALVHGMLDTIVDGHFDAIQALDDEVARLTASICAKSPVAIAMGKQMFYSQLEMGLDAAYQQASEVMACNMMCEDAAEGIDAFMAKRKPVWTGK